MRDRASLALRETNRVPLSVSAQRSTGTLQNAGCQVRRVIRVARSGASVDQSEVWQSPEVCLAILLIAEEHAASVAAAVS